MLSGGTQEHMHYLCFPFSKNTSTLIDEPVILSDFVYGVVPPPLPVLSQRCRKLETTSGKRVYLLLHQNGG